MFALPNHAQLPFTKKTYFFSGNFAYSFSAFAYSFSSSLHDLQFTKSNELPIFHFLPHTTSLQSLSLMYSKLMEVLLYGLFDKHKQFQHCNHPTAQNTIQDTQNTEHIVWR